MPSNDTPDDFWPYSADRVAIPPKTRFRILQRDAFTCQYCGRRAPTVALEVDHQIPVALGGESEDANLITACFDCNRGKGAVAQTDGGKSLDGGLRRTPIGVIPKSVKVPGTLPNGKDGYIWKSPDDLDSDECFIVAMSYNKAADRLAHQAEAQRAVARAFMRRWEELRSPPPPL